MVEEGFVFEVEVDADCKEIIWDETGWEATGDTNISEEDKVDVFPVLEEPETTGDILYEFELELVVIGVVVYVFVYIGTGFTFKAEIDVVGTGLDEIGETYTLLVWLLGVLAIGFVAIGAILAYVDADGMTTACPDWVEVETITGVLDVWTTVWVWVLAGTGCTTTGSTEIVDELDGMVGVVGTTTGVVGTTTGVVGTTTGVVGTTTGVVGTTTGVVGTITSTVVEFCCGWGF